jgi:tRNA threonylcarbamoyladenosine biosynthesis protein TsaE
MDLIFALNNINTAAQQFLAAVGNSKVFAFNGQMGAGKTTFIHAVCETLGVEEAIGSPTFSIINHYRAANGETIYHIDLYRVKDEEEAIQAGVEDCLYSGNFCFVEWPGKASSIFPEETIQVNITAVENETRKLTINL